MQLRNGKVTYYNNPFEHGWYSYRHSKESNIYIYKNYEGKQKYVTKVLSQAPGEKPKNPYKINSRFYKDAKYVGTLNKFIGNYKKL